MVLQPTRKVNTSTSTPRKITYLRISTSVRNSQKPVVFANIGEYVKQFVEQGLTVKLQYATHSYVLPFDPDTEITETRTLYVTLASIIARQSYYVTVLPLQNGIQITNSPLTTVWKPVQGNR